MSIKSKKLILNITEYKSGYNSRVSWIAPSTYLAKYRRSGYISPDRFQLIKLNGTTSFTNTNSEIVNIENDLSKKTSDIDLNQ